MACVLACSAARRSALEPLGVGALTPIFSRRAATRAVIGVRVLLLLAAAAARSFFLIGVWDTFWMAAGFTLRMLLPLAGVGAFFGVAFFGVAFFGVGAFFSSLAACFDVAAFSSSMKL